MFQQAVIPSNNGHGTEDDLEEGREFVFQNKPSVLLRLKFDNLNYKVNVGKNSKSKKICEKQILHGLCGSVAPGEMLALMGPSGSGKSTLLNLLSGRIQNNWTGTITYGGHPYNTDLKKRIGFVAQNDVVFPHLTVKETIIYSALLRLPRTQSKDQKTKRAHEIISALYLERCQNTMVGGLFVRGISGGERKRVCIALEILTDPSLLFFDEPTSGLDSTMALRIIEIGRNLSKNGMTVVMAIHQPSSRLYEQFDKLMLLSEGHCTYLGQAQDALNYFRGLGFKPLIEMNPPEFFLDLCSGNVSGIETPKDLKVGGNKNSQNDHSDHSNNEYLNDKEGQQLEDLEDFTDKVSKNSQSDDSDQLNKDSLNGEEGQKVVKEYVINAYISKVRARAEEITEINEKTTYERAQAGASWLTQFQVLAVRDFRERFHEYLNMTRFIELIAIAVVSGLLWFKSSFSTDSGLGDQVGLIFYIVMIWGIFPLFQAIYVFPQERAMLAKDRANDMYSMSSYFMARSLVDVPLDLATPSLFILILAPMAGMRGPASIFFVRLLAIYLIVLTSQGLGLVIGALVMDAKKANSLATVILIAYVLSGGIFVQNIPKFISWFKYISYQYYGFNLLMKIEYTPEMVYDCGPHGCYTLGTSPVLHGLNLDGGRNEALCLFAMIVVYRVLAYLVLRFQKPSPPN